MLIPITGKVQQEPTRASDISFLENDKYPLLTLIERLSILVRAPNFLD